MTDPSIFYTTNIGDPYGPRDFAPDPFHDGVDFSYGSGVDIPAPAACQVAGKGTGGDYGNTVTVLIEGRYWAFCHLLAPSPRAIGEQVPYGGNLRQVGNTGFITTGAHLHVECTTIPAPGSGGIRQDPLPLLTAMVSGSQPPTNTENEEEMAKIIVSCTDIAGAGGQSGNKSFVIFGPAREGYPVVEVTTNQNRINGLLFARGKNLAQFDYTSLPNLSFAQMTDAVKLETGMNAASQNSYVNGFRWPAA